VALVRILERMHAFANLPKRVMISDNIAVDEPLNQDLQMDNLEVPLSME
jgi:hypothetical protein